MAAYAEVNSSGQVLNLVNWDGVSTFNVSPNTLVATGGNVNAQIGGTYIGGVFTAPAPGAAAQGIIWLQQPASGASLQIPNVANAPGNAGYRKLRAVMQVAATLATLTLTLPTAPQDGDVVTLWSTHAVTALTVTPNAGQTGFALPTSLGIEIPVDIEWSAQYSTWFCL